ncbi:MAG: uncharacterized protein A8A55_2470, partial [Amphiamblys sp. WSBS2006]
PKHIAEILKMENKSIWVGRVRKLLGLVNYTTGILSKLRIHEENAMEKLSLCAYRPEYITEILKMENNSIDLGKVKRLELYGYTIEILPKFKLHRENELEELVLSSKLLEEYTPEILKMENNSIWVGRVKMLELRHYAVGILPKLKLHRENAMEKLLLEASCSGHIAGMLKMKDKSIWIGKVKEINITGCS